jgi:AcrR family transcriptional regulator
MKKAIKADPPRREKERQARRGEILEAAERIFRREGFARASMDAIAAEAQFTKRTVYKYFDDKEDLLYAVALEASKRLFVRQAAILAQEEPGLAKIRRAALAYYEFSRDLPDLFRLVEEARRLKPRRKDTPGRSAFVRYRTDMFGEYGKALRAGISDGSVRSDIDPDLLVFAFVLVLTGFFQALSEATAAGTFASGADAFAKLTLDLVSDALRPPLPAPPHASGARGDDPWTSRKS